MTLEEAERVRTLLKTRDALVHNLKMVEECRAISGQISDGTNGLGFTWGGKGFGFQKEACREIKYLVAGYKADIAAIDQTIRHLASPNFPEKEECK